MGVIRTTILVLAVAVMLPSPPDSREARVLAADGAQFVQTAVHAMSDLGVSCAGDAGVCSTAEYVLTRIESKARYNLNLLYGWASSEGHAISPLATQAASDPVITGSAPRLLIRKADASQNTLRIDDLIPSWRGPKASNKG
jgi:hypothetical protein